MDVPNRRLELCDRFYGYLYVGLYYDALGNKAEAKKWMEKCVDQQITGYMGDVAKVHLDLLNKDVQVKDSKSESGKPEKK